MDNNQLRKLAGLPVITEKQWSGKVETKKTPPEGLFASGSKKEVCEWLKNNHKDFAGAMSSLNFYINRAGKNLDAQRRGTLESCKDELRKMYGVKEALEPFDMELLRKMAGITPAVAEDKEEETDEMEDEAEGEEEVDEVAEMLTKIAADAEGKTGEELVAVMRKVYDAGFEDGEEAHEEESKEKVDEAARKDLAAKKAAASAQKPAEEKSGTLTASIGIAKEDDAGWVAVELAKAGMTVDMEEAMGVFYFNFKNKQDEARARNIAAKLQVELV